MKIRILIINALIVVLFACNTSKNDYQKHETTIVNGVEIPIIRLDLAPDSAKIINLSALVSEIDIIPLETKKECLISHANPYFSDEYIFVWTQVNMQVFLYEFDYNGKFIREIGSRGKGPGEFTGYRITGLKTFDDKKQIAVKVLGDLIKLFQYNGKYLRNIYCPISGNSNFNRFNDSLYFTIGSIAGIPQNKSDSIMLAFYTIDGKLLKEFPRKEYTSHKKGKLLPEGWGGSVYQYKNEWKIYNPGNDTLYSLSYKALSPAAIFSRGEKGHPYHQNINVSEIIDKYRFVILSETDNYLIIKKELVTGADLWESPYGWWGGMWNLNYFLIILDKNTGKLHNIRIKDDILGLLQEQFLTKRTNQWSETMVGGAIQAIDLNEELAKALKRENLPENARARLTKLNSELLDDDNPVVLRFLLKDRFEL